MFPNDWEIKTNQKLEILFACNETHKQWKRIRLCRSISVTVPWNE